MKRGREMVRSKGLALALIGASLLLGCGSPKDRELPTDVSKMDELKPYVEKLSEEEKKLFLGYVFRATVGGVFGGKGVEPGMTIGKAIDAQKSFIEENARKEAEAKALKEKLAAEQAAIKKSMTDAVTVTVLSMRLEKQDYREEQLIKLGLKNNGDKDIKGVKGMMRFIDMFDKEVGAIGFAFTDGLKHGEVAVWSGTRHYNQFMSEHKAIAQLEEGKYKAVFDPEAIVFEDGTNLTIKN